MEPTAWLIAIAYGALVLAGTGVALLVWRSTRSPADVDEHALAERERRWLWIVLVVLASLLLATIWFTPYGESAPEGAQRMRVVASQFSWQLEPRSVRAGVPVELTLEATDVNHGFGVYDPDGDLVYQVQVMPGRAHRTVETFERPGTYRVLCFEFCGVLHHAMEAEFEVTP